MVDYSDRFHSNGQLVDHCLALLSYVSKNPNDNCTIRELSDKCGIPLMTLWHILDDAHNNRSESTLLRVAFCYGFDFMIYKGYNRATNQYIKGKVISAVKIKWETPWLF